MAELEHRTTDEVGRGDAETRSAGGLECPASVKPQAGDRHLTAEDDHEGIHDNRGGG